MEEVIKYFESLEARIAEYEKRIAALEEAQQTNEAVIASMEAEIEELKSRPLPEPQVVEKVVEKVIEKPIEIPVSRDIEISKEPEQAKVEPEPVVEPEPEPGASPQSNGESGLRLEGQTEEPMPAPVVEEQASPKAAVYGKPVDDIRQAISLGDRFLYQRELFGQNAELMQRTLTEINELQSFDEAMSYINSRFQWDTESNSYQQFVVSLHRRFG